MLPEKRNALIQITAIYILIGAVGYASYVVMTGAEWLRFLVADGAMTIVVFACSLWKRNSSVYDAYWSVIPFYFLIVFFIATDGLQWDWTQWDLK